VGNTEIRQFQTFITIVELGGFSKAAEQLGYAQSTITSHIQILENDIGAALFDRLGKSIILTNAGKELVPYAKEMLNIYNNIKNIASDSSCVSGDLVIGAGESLSVYRLGEILKEFKKNFPKVNIILKNSICSDLRNKLRSGELDIVFTIEPEIKDKDLIVKKLKNENMAFVGSSEDELSFLSSNIVFTEKGCSSRIFFENYLKQKKIKYANPLEFSSIETIKKCVINGLGISLLPLYAVNNEIKDGSIKAMRLEEKFNKFSTQLIYHKNKRISLAMSKFIEIALENSLNWE